MESQILYTYVNGDYKVTIYSDGTKEREWDETKVSKPNFPESIDVKITDFCDLNCPYCHENSTTQGKEGDLNGLLSVLEGLPKGIELAIGGGNPLSHPGLPDFLQKLKEMGFIANLTVNQRHVKVYQNLLKRLVTEELVYGIGVSLSNPNDLGPIREIGSPNIVFHVIAGVNSLEDVKVILANWENPRILVLGYKDFGRGAGYRNARVTKNLKEWYGGIRDFLGGGSFSFDNLAIDQLDIRRLVTDEAWSRFFQGEDFSFSMYIDAVEKTYAPTSRSSDRIPWSLMGLQKYFQTFSKFWL